MTNTVLKALTRDDIATILAAIESSSGEERRARAEGKVIVIGGWFKPTVWANRVPPERDGRLIGPLSALSQDARNELQALFYLGRDSAPFFQSLGKIKTLGDGIRQIEYLYGNLLHADDCLREGLRKIDSA